MATTHARLRRQFMVNAQQQREELRVVQSNTRGMAWGMVGTAPIFEGVSLHLFCDRVVQCDVATSYTNRTLTSLDQVGPRPIQAEYETRTKLMTSAPTKAALMWRKTSNSGSGLFLTR